MCEPLIGFFTEFSASANCLRLAFSYASPEEIEVGVERLAAAM